MNIYNIYIRYNIIYFWHLDNFVITYLLIMYTTTVIFMLKTFVFLHFFAKHLYKIAKQLLTPLPAGHSLLITNKRENKTNDYQQIVPLV